ncbi:hypothetical protein ID866_10433 [Astraeus odoratus]|nr:hypothetical protein ID866_10433 [Astraeus odoratus]
MHGLTPPKHLTLQVCLSTMYSATSITPQTWTEHQQIQV